MATEHRSYADPCGVARALDVLGERWALLVIRELSLGPRRFGQLRIGLPDVSPNVLSQRLRELEADGVVRRYEVEPPGGTTAYELTERGYALDPLLRELGRWGAREPDRSGRDMSPVSFVRSLRVLVDPAAADVVYALTVDGEPFTLTIAGGAAEVTRGRPDSPVAGLAGSVGVLGGAVFRGLDVRALEQAGALTVTGDERAARRFPKLFRVPPASGAS